MGYAIVSQPSKWLFPNKKNFFFFFKLISFPCLTPPKHKALPAANTNTDSVSIAGGNNFTDTTPPPLIGPSNMHVAKDDDELRDVFDHLDVDKDGKISSKELMDYFGSVGEAVNHKGARRVVNEFDSDGDELLDFGDFVRLMKQEDNGELEDVLRGAFEMFEVEKGCGCITPKGLQQMLRQLGDVKSHEECEAMIRPFDLDGNGFLDSKIKDEFAPMTPVLAIFILLDGIQGVLSGMTRGCGWQHLATFVNLLSYYLIGLPISCLLGFKFKFQVKGLRIGLICGLACQTGILLLLWRIKWTKLNLNLSKAEHTLPHLFNMLLKIITTWREHDDFESNLFVTLLITGPSV